ncbi:putative 5-formyltetrahydrofolate cyclo-ligase [Lachnellula subtilissima]|uniref:5-formyltetrahydrofolate cyclo-ligase n=1 Tax=Lachnellula subtilissima TaxID=602034 RepID=A0A8H8UEI5_9HELO|nr:putative 5-formyltetrahydrofolate cyclo-ligase [Lachnellula subtilissima]
MGGEGGEHQESNQNLKSAGNMASSAAIKLAKKELRSAMKQKLSTISQESINVQSTAVFERITSLKLYQNAKYIGVYLSMPSGEIQTDAIVRHALESGKQVFVPYLHKSQTPSPNTPRSVMEMVDLRSLSDYDSLTRDSWGIPTIDAENIREREHILGNSTKETRQLDMILMPGVAFDMDPKSGYVRRLGHGKGFYDYFLHRYMQGRGSQTKEPSESPGADVLLYGLALHEQLIQAETDPPVPIGEHDHLLHGLLVGDGRLVQGAE